MAPLAKTFIALNISDGEIIESGHQLVQDGPQVGRTLGVVVYASKPSPSYLTANPLEHTFWLTSSRNGSLVRQNSRGEYQLQTWWH